MNLGIDTLVKISFSSIWSSRLRTLITITIIALGIMALVGINIVIDSIKESITSSFSSLGVSTILIDAENKIEVGSNRSFSEIKTPIKEEEVESFKNLYELPAAISSYFWSKGGVKASFGETETNPSLDLLATDESYLETKDMKVLYGRNFTKSDTRSGTNVCLLGSGVAEKLFDNKQKAIDTFIHLDGKPYLVLAVLEPKGSSMGRSEDNSVLITQINAKTNYPSISPNYYILLKNKSGQSMGMVRDEATSAMRQARKRTPSENNNFNINTNDDLLKSMNENLNYVSIAAMLIGIITLISAAVSLMNIMLVSVTERTKEVGLQKAIGATSSNVRNQFLTESILISVLGGIAGILLGVLIALALSFYLKTDFSIPWMWISIGLSVCIAVGLMAGIYPARLASKLQPIEALRYE